MERSLRSRGRRFRPQQGRSSQASVGFVSCDGSVSWPILTAPYAGALIWLNCEASGLASTSRKAGLVFPLSEQETQKQDDHSQARPGEDVANSRVKRIGRSKRNGCNQRNDVVLAAVGARNDAA